MWRGRIRSGGGLKKEEAEAWISLGFFIKKCILDFSLIKDGMNKDDRGITSVTLTLMIF